MKNILIHDIDTEIRKVQESGHVETPLALLEDRLEQVRSVFKFGQIVLSSPKARRLVQQALDSMKDAVVDSLARPWDFKQAYEFSRLYNAMVQQYLPG